jgi:hypothetical protein
MTIRDYIKRRVRWTMAIGLGGFILFAFGGGAAGVPIFAIIGAIGFGGAILLIGNIRCPRCRASLGQTIAMPVGMYFVSDKVNFCPYCGVSLDEPMP